MAKINARGDEAAIKLRKPNGGLVVVTKRGRLLEQRIAGDGYHVVSNRWVSPGGAVSHRQDVTSYLLEHRYPGAEVLS